MTSPPNLRYLLGIIVTRANDLGKALEALPESEAEIDAGVAAMSAEERAQVGDYLTALAQRCYLMRQDTLWLKRHFEEIS